MAKSNCHTERKLVGFFRVGRDDYLVFTSFPTHPVLHLTCRYFTFPFLHFPLIFVQVTISGAKSDEIVFPNNKPEVATKFQVSIEAINLQVHTFTKRQDMTYV